MGNNKNGISNSMKPHDFIKESFHQFLMSVIDIKEYKFFKEDNRLFGFSEDLSSHLYLTLDKLYPVIDDSHKTAKVIAKSVEGMSKDEVIVFSEWLLHVISSFPIYYYAQVNLKSTLLFEYNERGEKRKDVGYGDREIAEIHIGIEIRTSIQDKLEFLISKKGYYLHEQNYYNKSEDYIYNPNTLYNAGERERTLTEYIDYVEKSIELIELKKRILLEDEDLKKGRKIYGFINNKQVYKKVVKIFEDNVEPNQSNKINELLLKGLESSNNNRIRFLGNTKTLTFCFYQLGVLNKLLFNIKSSNYLNKDKLPEFIAKNFTTGKETNDATLRDTLYRYIISRNGICVPKKPLFAIYPTHAEGENEEYKIILDPKSDEEKERIKFFFKK